MPEPIDADVIVIPPADLAQIRGVIQKRLDFAHARGKVAAGFMFVIDEDAVLAIAERCMGNIGWALYLLIRSMPTPVGFFVRVTEQGNTPYHIKAADVPTDITEEEFGSWHDFWRNVCVIDMEAIPDELPENLRTALLAEDRKALHHMERVIDQFRDTFALQVERLPS